MLNIPKWHKENGKHKFVHTLFTNDNLSTEILADKLVGTNRVYVSIFGVVHAIKV